MKYEVDFIEPPPVGLKLKFDGRPFELVGREPYTRTDGRKTTLLAWRTQCSVCGDEVVVKTGLKSKTVTKRCQEHRERGVPATPEAAERMLAPRRRFARVGKV